MPARRLLTALLITVAAIQLGTVSIKAAATYQLDNNTISTALNASDGTEPLDNWFGNVFTVTAGANLITSVDFGLFTCMPSAIANVILYKVTGAGGNPALGATRVYTQAFTPLTGDNTNAFLQTIDLTSPVLFNTGDKFLVAILIRNVIAAPPNDVYPYLLDTSGSAAGSFWARANPNTFNLDNLTGARQVDQPLVSGGYTPGAAHLIIRANAVPEPGAMALLGLGSALLMIKRRKK